MSSREVMPDFVDALEARLRADAAAASRSRRSHRQRPVGRWRRGGLIALAAVAVVAVTVAALGLRERSSQPAYASNVALVRSTPVDVNANPRVRAIARSVAPKQAVSRVWAAPAFGGSAYLVRGSHTWCLSAPDPAAGQPDIERGSSCTDDAGFTRIGISLGIGNNFIAIVPDDVRAPRLHKPGKPARVLRPSPRGVVVLAELPAGSVITMYDRSGHARHNTIRTGPTEPTTTVRCPDGSRLTMPATSPKTAARCPGGEHGGT